INVPFLLTDFTFEKLKSNSIFARTFIDDLELNQYLKIELQGILTKGECIGSGLPYKRSKSLRDYLVNKNDVCINRVIINVSVGVLSKGSIGDVSVIRVRLAKTSSFEDLPRYR